MSTELVLLGTAGGPMPRSDRHAPAQVLLVDGVAYLIDCGNGVAQQLWRADVPFPSLRAVFVTHHHSDHNADVGNLFLLAWSALRQPVQVIGPPPLVAMTASFFELNRFDLEIRTADEARPPLQDFVAPEEISAGGLVYADERVEVRATLVDHPPIPLAFAYRFDTADRSIVISGDTRPCDALVELATGADVLVHEALFPSAIELFAAGNNGARIREHILGCHTAVEDVGAIAERAGVGCLVLSHLAPANKAVVPDATWEEAARRGYSGRVVVGQDLLRL